VDYRSQLATFIIMVVTGMVLGGMFDFYRIVRGVVRLRRIWASLADLLYWLLAAGVVFGALLLGNWGELRLYVFLGLLAGLIFYYRLLSKWTIRLIVAMLRLVQRLTMAVRLVLYYSILKPAGLLARLAISPLVYLKRKFLPPDGNNPPQ
jgi:spore cortex biosynthesis protein YabQ